VNGCKQSHDLMMRVRLLTGFSLPVRCRRMMMMMMRGLRRRMKVVVLLVLSTFEKVSFQTKVFFLVCIGFFF